MQKIKLIRFVESVILLPIVTMSSVPIGSISPISQAAANIIIAPSILSSQKLNIKAEGVLNMAFTQATDLQAIELKAKADKVEKAEAIDVYFKARNMPLAGTGMKMVEEAEKNDLDWRLLPAIAVRESTGGKNECKKVSNNAFGWGSCKIGFKSNEDAITVVAKNLGGNNPRTARHYDDKDVRQILRSYNPPHIVPRYAEQVISIMNTIGKEDIVLALTS